MIQHWLRIISKSVSANRAHLTPILLLVLVSGLSQKTMASEGAWTNELGAKGISFQESNSPAVNNQLGLLKLSSQYENKFFEQLKLKINFVFISDPTNKSPEEKNSFDFQELNMKFKNQDIVYKLGWDIYNWGITDGYNPVDLLNTRNYFDPIHSRKLGAFSFSTNYAGDTAELDLVFIPQARESTLPGGASRWLPREVYVSQSSGGTTKLLLPTTLNYQFDYRKPVDNALDANAAVRLQFHLSELELAFYAYDGVAPLPLLSPYVNAEYVQYAPPITTIKVLPDVTLRVQSYRQQTGGFSFNKSFESWQLKGVTTWTQPSQNVSTQLNWSQESVVAFEKPWAISANANFITILQYANIRRPTSSGNDLASISRFFDSNLMLGGTFMWRDTDTYTFFQSYDTLKYSQLSELSYERKLTDSTKLNLGLSSIDGANDSPIGVYAKNKSFSIGMSHIF
jgi:hypothetical protein